LVTDSTLRLLLNGLDRHSTQSSGCPSTPFSGDSRHHGAEDNFALLVADAQPFPNRFEEIGLGGDMPLVLSLLEVCAGDNGLSESYSAEGL